MLIKSYNIFLLFLLLVSCGGTSNSPRLADEIAVNTTNHQSGKKIYLGKEVFDGVMRSFAASVSSESALDDAFNETVVVNISRISTFASSTHGVFKEVRGTKGSQSFYSIVYVDDGTSEEVSMAAVFPTIIADGAELTSIPTGQFTYEGGILNYNDGMPQSGSFTMVADFDAGGASLTGSTSTYVISANNILINTATGQFDSNSLSINNPYSSFGQNSWVGEIDGMFTGSAASGVVGVYSSTDGRILGGIAGTR